ncbi:MAG TPA: four helix bundle protein [Luteolibacter sp.]|nr:four helix bundle protein [Luteolibacter sp.]
MNIERPTSNVEVKKVGYMKEGSDEVYDLEERLLNYGAAIIGLTRKLSTGEAERHVSHQLLRSGTAPLSHHGEAQGAESRADFIHKLSLALKEMRESERWLKLIRRAGLIQDPSKVDPLLSETDELIRILASSLRTAKCKVAATS